MTTFYSTEPTELERAEAIEIDRLKWLESEKRGHDIGIYYARWIWLTTHRKPWLAALRASGHHISGSHVQH